MFQEISYQKEKRKKRLTQKNLKKTTAVNKHEKSKRQIKHFFSYEEQYLDNWELINSR